jgi:hypothetical protein
VNKDFKLAFEGLSQAEQTDLTAIVARVAALSKAAADGLIGDRVTWFGTLHSSAIVSEGLKTMSKYLNEKCVRLTFVRKHVGQIVDQVAAESSDYGQVLPNIDQTVANFVRSAPHVSSGLRIYAMDEISDAIANNDRKEKLNYVYHEISHKVLNTVDYEYGESSCKKLAIDWPKFAVRNADNWGYYLAELDSVVP